MSNIFQQIQGVMTNFGIKSLLLVIAVYIGISIAKKTYKLCESLSNNLQKAVSILSFITIIVYFTEQRSSVGLLILVPCGLIFIAISMILDTWELKKENKSK